MSIGRGARATVQRFNSLGTESDAVRPGLTNSSGVKGAEAGGTRL